MPSTLPPLLHRALEAAGIDRASLQGAGSRFMSAGAEASMGDSVDTVDVTRQELQDLFAVAVDLLGEPHLALRLASHTSARTYGPAELAARASATVGEALSNVAACATLVHGGLSWAFDPAAGSFCQAAPEPQRRASRHLAEYGLAFALTLARQASGAPLTVTRAWFAHARPADLGPLHRFFETRDLVFGAEESGFTLDEASLGRAIPTHDARLLAVATDLASAARRKQAPAGLPTALASGVFSSLVGAQVARRLAENPSMDDVSAALHMSPRTLQRRLGDEGARFSEIVDFARQERARELIRDPEQSLGAIAFALGFAELATFSRAFKRWTGKPPGAFRRPR